LGIGNGCDMNKSFFTECEDWRLEATFGSQWACVGGEERMQDMFNALSEKYDRWLDEDWTELFKDYLFEQYLEPLYFDAGIRMGDVQHYGDMVTEWFVHATEYSVDGVPSPGGAAGVDRDKQILEAMAGSSEAFVTAPLMALEFQEKEICKTVPPLERPWEMAFKVHTHADRVMDMFQKKFAPYSKSLKSQNRRSLHEGRGHQKKNKKAEVESIGNVFTTAGLAIEGDGMGTDNQAFIPLLKQIENNIGVGNLQGGSAVVLPTVLMVMLPNLFDIPADVLAESQFYQTSQYFLPKIPRKFAAPLTPVYSVLDVGDNGCDELYDMVPNVNYVLNLGNSFASGCGTTNKRCKKGKSILSAGKAGFDPTMYNDIYSTLDEFGIMVSPSALSVVSNSFWNLEGGWSISQFTLVSQWKTQYSQSWLKLVAPTYFKSSASAWDFPSYQKMSGLIDWNQMMLMPVWEAFLSSNYMSHLANVVVCCTLLQDYWRDLLECQFCEKYSSTCFCSYEPVM